jgi:CRP-like cAMP-binding protein
MRRRRGPQESELANVGLFAGCTRKELADISQLTFQVDRSAGDTLCREGETGLECLIIVEGEASVTVAGTLVALMGPGDFVGELALLDSRPRVATVTALTDVRLLALSRREFNSLLTRVPCVAPRMLATMGSRLRSADELVVAGPRALAPI